MSKAHQPPCIVRAKQVSRLIEGDLSYLNLLVSHPLCALTIG